MENNDRYIGMMLDNRYEILEQVGAGGMAVVYKARCHRLNRFVAVKILRDEYASDDDFRRRFHAESQAVAMLSHPNIVAVYDVNRTRDIEYLVMELIDGLTLKQYMSRRGDLNWREALHFTTQVVRALDHAHSRGIIHRDIKPHNIMVLRDGSVKVADFGIARFVSSQNTLTQEALGSVHYISPEQAKGSHIDARADIYSVGVVMYEMLTGRLPFEGESAVSVAIQHINSLPLSPREIAPNIPEGLEEIIMKAMAPNPAKRYLSAAEMYKDLEEFRKNPAILFGYNLNEFDVQIASSEEEPTKMLPIIEAGRDNSLVSGSKRERTMTKSKPKQGRSVAMLVAVLAVLIFVGGLLFFLWNIIKPILYPESNTITVPSFEGQMYEDIIADPEYRGLFEFEKSEEVIYDENLPGTVVYQRPAEGRKVNPGDTITLTVSQGIKSAVLSDYTNMELRSVEVDLTKNNVTIGEIIYENSEEVLKDRIIRTDPEAGSNLVEGQSVNLYVSLGPNVVKVKMLDLIGRTEEEAKLALKNAKLTFEGTTMVESSTEAGLVVWQSVQPQMEIDEGTPIRIQVSLGPPTTIEPSPTPTATPTPTPTVSEQPTAVTKMLPIKLKSSNSTVRVQVQVNGTTVYDEVVETALENITVPITGTGRVWVDIWLDEIHSGANELILTE